MMMPARKTPKTDNQSARFIEAAKATGADESGKKFERAFKKIVPAKKPLTANITNIGKPLRGGDLALLRKAGAHAYLTDSELTQLRRLGLIERHSNALTELGKYRLAEANARKP